MSEFDDVIRLLREERPQASEPELDQIKQRVRKRAATSPRKGQSMRSRLAILGMLVVGMLMSGTGATLAVTGFTTSNDAGEGQYGSTPTPTPTPAPPAATPTPAGDTLGESEDNAGSGSGNQQPDEAAQNETTPDAAKPARQVEAGGQSELPFTGFAAIPILLIGAALLGTGLMLRRRQGEH